MKVDKGSEATFEAIDFDDNADISWTVEGGKPGTSTGTGTKFTTDFALAGSAMVTAKQNNPVKTATFPVTVVGAKSAAPGGVVLPFVIRNWGRLVVTLLGVGIVAALMTLDVITGEGGIGLLGALLGVGAATANTDPDVRPPQNPES